MRCYCVTIGSPHESQHITNNMHGSDDPRTVSFRSPHLYDNMILCDCQARFKKGVWRDNVVVPATFRNGLLEHFFHSVSRVSPLRGTEGGVFVSRIPEELDELFELYERYNNGDWEDEEEKIYLEEILFPSTLED